METFPHDVPPFKELEDMGQEAMDALPFGILVLDQDGQITGVNRSEATRTGREPAEFIGRNFFGDVAPCTDVQEFAGVFRDGARRGDLREVFNFRFPTPSGDWQPVVVYIASASPGHGWVMATLAAPPDA